MSAAHGSQSLIAAVPRIPARAHGAAPLTVALTLSADQFAELAEAVAARLQPVEHSTPWLSTEQAAAYLAAKPAWIHDLVQLGKLTPRRDGRRLLFARADLDAYLEASI